MTAVIPHEHGSTPASRVVRAAIRGGERRRPLPTIGRERGNAVSERPAGLCDSEQSTPIRLQRASVRDRTVTPGPRPSVRSRRSPRPRTAAQNGRSSSSSASASGKSSKSSPPPAAGLRLRRARRRRARRALASPSKSPPPPSAAEHDQLADVDLGAVARLVRPCPATGGTRCVLRRRACRPSSRSSRRCRRAASPSCSRRRSDATPSFPASHPTASFHVRLVASENVATRLPPVVERTSGSFPRFPISVTLFKLRLTIPPGERVDSSPLTV